jgi:branched-chain amino acid transport system permease protein
MMDFLQHLIDALSLGSLYALAALGIGLLFGILRLINFAHGDFIMLGAYALIAPSADVAAHMVIGGWSWIFMIPAICVIVVIVALASNTLVFRPLRHADTPILMIASFAVGYVIENSVIVIYGARAKTVDFWSELNYPIAIAGLRIAKLELVIIATTVVLMLGLILFLRRTSFGVQMRAAAEDFRMAQYLGVRSELVIGAAFAVSGVLAAAVSLLFLCQTGALTYSMGTPLVLFAFIATVVGGMGSLLGAVVGGYVIGLTITFLQAYLPSELRDFRDAFAFGLVVLILIFRPSGLVTSKHLLERA